MQPLFELVCNLILQGLCRLLFVSNSSKYVKILFVSLFILFISFFNYFDDFNKIRIIAR